MPPTDAQDGRRGAYLLSVPPGFIASGRSEAGGWSELAASRSCRISARSGAVPKPARDATYRELSKKRVAAIVSREPVKKVGKVGDALILIDPYSTAAPGQARGVNVVTQDFTLAAHDGASRAASRVTFWPSATAEPPGLRALDLLFTCDGVRIDERQWQAAISVIRSDTVWVGEWEELGAWPARTPAQDFAPYAESG